MQDQLEMLTRREEWMASQALRLGQVTVQGEEAWEYNDELNQLIVDMKTQLAKANIKIGRKR